MEHEIDLTRADRDVLIGIIVRQQAIIERLEKRIAQLEGQAKSKAGLYAEFRGDIKTG